MVRTCLLFLFLLFASLLLAQQPRFALVIGNGDYEYASLGPTPANDAGAVRDALILAGFSVDYYTNLDQSKLSTVITAFGRKIKDSGGVALFYYSGHGVQHNNTNYLVPIGAEMTDEEDIEGLCVPISRITSRMLSAGTATNIVVLDACRAFPISRGTKSLTQGLVKENYAVPELLVAYATAPGSTATIRGENGLSLYTSQWLKHLKTPGLVLENVLKNTRRDVIAKSNGQQRPDQAGILSSDFYFFSAAEPAQKDTERTVPEEPIIKPSDSRNPGGVDSDLDGTPDATDPCPNDYGTLAANGCPDYDEDGVPNSVDKCPNLAGKKAWQGCPDSDEDGVPDHEDKCPFEPGTLADKGCLSPNEDRDGDGVLNSTDKCPSIKGSPENGCPSPPFVKKHVVLQGETLLSLAKKYNLIVAEITQVNKFDNDEQLSSGKTILIPISAIGVDSDSDGIPDREDNCTRLKGPALYKGCPNLEPYGYGPDDLVMVTEGNFLMGRIDFGNEQPIHNVSVPTFELGKYEVTNAQYCVFLNDINIKDTINISSESGKVIYKGNVIFRSNNEGDNHLTREIIFGEYSGDLQVGTLFSPKSGYENHPAVLVSWHGANAYCNWLSQKTGQHYRLPSEAEWEFAAKGGNASKGFKYAGGNSLDDVAWYSANSDDKRHPVGQKKNNELGLYDMNGNVWEWCADSWHDSYLNAPNDGSAWFSNQNLYLMVSRGGSYFNRERDLPRRAPESSPEKTAKGLGFRIARDIERK